MLRLYCGSSGSEREIEPKELLSFSIPGLLIAYTLKLEILVTALLPVIA